MDLQIFLFCCKSYDIHSKFKIIVNIQSVLCPPATPAHCRCGMVVNNLLIRASQAAAVCGPHPSVHSILIPGADETKKENAESRQ